MGPFRADVEEPAAGPLPEEDPATGEFVAVPLEFVPADPGRGGLPVSASGQAPMPPALEARGLRKVFGPLVALDGADVTVASSENNVSVSTDGTNFTSFTCCSYTLSGTGSASIDADCRSRRTCRSKRKGSPP